MKVKVDIGWLALRMSDVVEYHRLKMTYGSRVVSKSRGMFKSRESQNSPIEDSSDYWMIMIEFSPWNKMNGLFSAIGYGNYKHEVELSIDAYAMIVTAVHNMKQTNLQDKEGC